MRRGSFKSGTTVVWVPRFSLRRISSSRMTGRSYTKCRFILMSSSWCTQLVTCKCSRDQAIATAAVISHGRAGSFLLTWSPYFSGDRSPALLTVFIWRLPSLAQRRQHARNWCICGYSKDSASDLSGSGARAFVCRNILTIGAKRFRYTEMLFRPKTWELKDGKVITVGATRSRYADSVRSVSGQLHSAITVLMLLMITSPRRPRAVCAGLRPTRTISASYQRVQ